MDDPSSSVSPADVIAGNRLTRAIVKVAGDARRCGVPDRVIVSALCSALGSLVVTVSRLNGSDLAAFSAGIARHFAYVVECEAQRRAATVH